MIINEEDYELTPLQEEASTRKYFLASHPDKESIVVCRDISINQDFIELARYLSDSNFLVPKIYGTNNVQNTIYQSFLGPDDMSTLPIFEYSNKLKDIIDVILKLQELDPPGIVRARKFDYDKLHSEILITIDAFSRWKTKFNLNTTISEELKIFFEECCAFLAKYPRLVFTHRDFHCRNLIITRENGIGLIDFQDARMGTPQYDLVSLLYDAYRPLDLDIRREYLEYYRERTKFKDYKFYETYYLQGLQRSFKALGTYLIQVGDRNNAKFIPSLFSCLKNLEELCQIGLLPDSVFIFLHELQTELELIELNMDKAT
ncbi:aminoglycoside phosphotransferase family protein [Leptospira sp. GIMC2001]|uniref:aminoglycoside phosphotransferase family protein n=1 Tax=Leptospira sp. GIMC2001 TaxID=1513297 RepID=UPI00234A0AF6|nr:phosphotransferase [Leptospira sp. GIMC2001]WCL49824.1 phosphotransferase [Leptospira sp. GIMC2001]